MTISSQNKFKSVIKEVFELPLWIKQIIYIELKEQLESPQGYINIEKKEDCLQLFIPRLTYGGKKELEIKAKNLSENTYLFLECAFGNISILEIAVKNNWSLYECSNYFLDALKSELISASPSPVIMGTSLFISGKIKLGEYFVKLNKITIEQLDKALSRQKYLEESIEDRPGLGEILVSLNFLNKNDLERILLLKEDCKKYYNPISEIQ